MQHYVQVFVSRKGAKKIRRKGIADVQKPSSHPIREIRSNPQIRDSKLFFFIVKKLSNLH